MQDASSEQHLHRPGPARRGPQQAVHRRRKRPRIRPDLQQQEQRLRAGSGWQQHRAQPRRSDGQVFPYQPAEQRQSDAAAGREQPAHQPLARPGQAQRRRGQDHHLQPRGRCQHRPAATPADQARRQQAEHRDQHQCRAAHALRTDAARCRPACRGGHPRQSAAAGEPADRRARGDGRADLHPARRLGEPATPHHAKRDHRSQRPQLPDRARGRAPRACGDRAQCSHRGSERRWRQGGTGAGPARARRRAGPVACGERAIRPGRSACARGHGRLCARGQDGTGRARRR